MGEKEKVRRLLWKVLAPAFKAVLGRGDGVIDVSGRPGYVWARKLGREELLITAFNRSNATEEGTTVLVRPRTLEGFSEYEVIDFFEAQEARAVVSVSTAADGGPIGGIIAYGGSVAPSGWLLCDGTAISRVTYNTLFVIIGTAYGVGDGSTTFNIPNLKQRFPLGKADAGTGNTLGAVGGAIDHTHTYNTVIAHIHSVDPPNRTSTGESAHTHASGLVEPGAGAFTTKQSVCGLAGASITTGAGSNHTHDVNIPSFNSGSTGDASGTTTSKNPPFQVVNYIIRT